METIHQNIFKNTDTFRTYKTYDRGVKRAEEAQTFRTNHLRYIIAATKEGRFYPVFVGKDSIELAHAGFPVTA